MTFGESSALRPLDPRVLGRFLAICLPVLLLLGGTTFVLYRQEATNERSVHARDALHIVDLLHGIIARQFESIESDLLFLAEEQHLRDYLSGRVETPRDVAQEYALYSRKRGIYDQIRYLDEDGRETVRVNAGNGGATIVGDGELQSKAHRRYFAESKGLPRGEIFVSTFDLNIEHGEIERPLKPMVRFATPVFDDKEKARGVVVLNYLGERVISEAKKASANTPGHVMLINREGFWISGPRPEDEWGFVFGNDLTLGADDPDAWNMISRSGEGQFVNERGLFTFRVVRRPGLFTIVSHVPSSELYARSGRLLSTLVPFGAIGAVLVMILVGFGARTSVEHRISEQKLKESEARLRAMSMRLATALEDDRRQLSRDLHDDLGQLITVIILDLERSAQAGNEDKRQEMIGRALRGSRQLLGRVQEISSRLRPRVLDELGLQEAVESFLAEFEARTGVEVGAVLDFQHHDIPAAASENAFRIIQESLTNVCKHAGVPQASLTLRVSVAQIAVTVSDEGVGFRLESVREKALGIAGMRERVELLGGEVDVQSEPGLGTRIHVRIPIESPTTGA